MDTGFERLQHKPLWSTVLRLLLTQSSCAAADASWLSNSAPLCFQGGGGREFQHAIPSHPGQRATFCRVHKISQKPVPTRLPSHKWLREQTQSSFIKKKPHMLHKHRWNIMQPRKWKAHSGICCHADESWSQEARCKRPHMVWWHLYEIPRTCKYIERDGKWWGGWGERTWCNSLIGFLLGWGKCCASKHRSGRTGLWMC